MTEPAVFAPGLLVGRTALVSGGGSGIGLAIARELGGLGARVVVAGRTVETLEKAVAELRRDGIDAAAHPVNIRREDEVAALFAAMGERFGAIDILVNN
ncbi:MAG TPA: SDR family NAD(P)-dependent oxidoreductase, partial [Dongiaceae bacterium]|nr:SDR family NAD(P)-dependent oxidoreductase [Dongiaceae bacterium]